MFIGRYEDLRRDRLAFLLQASLGAIIVSFGIFLIAFGIWESYAMTQVHTRTELDEYVMYHGRASAGVMTMAIGIAWLAFIHFRKGASLWRIREGERPKTKRDAIIIAIGVLFTGAGFGSAAIMLHQIYALPETASQYDYMIDHYTDMLLTRLVIGAAGSAVLAFGVLKSREPELVLEDERGPAPKGRKGLGASIAALGLLAMTSAFYFASAYWEEYSSRNDESWLAMLAIAGFAIGFIFMVNGMIVFAGSPPIPTFRGLLYPRKSEKDGGRE